ncbi:hypothetical protein CRG98_019948 [Punica granatum]|uniref:Uncharacterized protein n=1 Tax=Punica granatum TaxID=22663 RepID=A0A2I0JUY3_PUNGR|nr:hypothetical protein CRG98_019948 [Punica granatum]
MKVRSHGLADPARLQEARARWLGELAMQEGKLERVSRPGKFARGTNEIRRGCKKYGRGGSANLRGRKVKSQGLADSARLQGARAWWLNELARGTSSHGLENLARLQEARARWLGELAVQERNVERVSRTGKVARGTSEVAQRTCDARKYTRTALPTPQERGGSANLRCRKVSSHGLADPARLQEARARWLSELAMQESILERLSRPRKVARGTSEPTPQGCKRHERGGSANLRCKKVYSNGLADPARLQEARARWLGELAMQEIKLARVSRPGKVARSTSEVARRTCDARKKVSSHGLADPARLQEARARWLGELALQESKLERVSRPRKVARGTTGKVARGTSEVALRTCGAGKQERGGSANLRCRKVSSHGLADPARLQEARARQERGGSANLRCRKVSSHGLADPARLQEARARWLGELALQESKLERVSRPDKVARGRSETRQGCKRHERGGSANLRCRKVSSHGLADPARLQEARARWLGELAVQESKLARVSRPGKVARGTSEVARRTCGARNEPRSGWQTWKGCKRYEQGG